MASTNLHLLSQDELIEMVEGYRAAAMAFERALDTKAAQLREVERWADLLAERIDYLHDEIDELREDAA